MFKQPVQVAVAVIRNPLNQILIARRPDHVHQGGLWEFPGGKVEAGEDTFMALYRELQEELGISIKDSVPLITIQHQYPDKHVLLDVHEVNEFDGNPVGLEGQSIKWVSVDRLSDYSFPLANKSILNRIQLPHHYMITGDYSSPEEFTQRLEHALVSGVRLVQYRDHLLDKNKFMERASTALSLCHNYHAKLLLNADQTLLAQVNADGIHFISDKLMNINISDIPGNKLCSASVHNKAQIDKANSLGLDFIMLSPVLPTLSHPDSVALGWNKFKELIQQANMPVYALGGMQEEHLKLAQDAGAQGISAIRSLWNQ
jgi:8-oxo-dGTP diphosphatase